MYLDTIKNIILKGRKDITDNDVIFMYENYFKNFEYLKNLIDTEYHGKKLVGQILRCLSYKEINVGERIYKPGESHNSVLFILEGIIDKFTDIYHHKSLILSLMNSGIEVKNDESSLRFEETLTKFKTTGINEVSKKRNDPSVYICKTKVHVAELNKKDYWIIFEGLRHLKRQEGVKILRKVHFFSPDTSVNFLEYFLSFTKCKIFQYGDKIVSQGEEIDKLYIVKKGNFELSYKIKSKFNHIFRLDFFEKFKERFTESKKHEIKGFKSSIENYKLFMLGTGQVLGDLEYKHKLKESIFTATCTHLNSECLVIDFNIFSKIIVKALEEYFIMSTSNKELVCRQRLNDLVNAKEKDMKSINNQLMIEQLDYMDIDTRNSLQTEAKTNQQRKVKVNEFEVLNTNQTQQEQRNKITPKEKEWGPRPFSSRPRFHDTKLHEYSLKDKKSITKLNNTSTITIKKISASISKGGDVKKGNVTTESTYSIGNFNCRGGNKNSTPHSFNYVITTNTNQTNNIVFSSQTYPTEISGNKILATDGSKNLHVMKNSFNQEAPAIYRKGVQKKNSSREFKKTIVGIDSGLYANIANKEEAKIEGKKMFMLDQSTNDQIKIINTSHIKSTTILQTKESSMNVKYTSESPQRTRSDYKNNIATLTDDKELEVCTKKIGRKVSLFDGSVTAQNYIKAMELDKAFITLKIKEMKNR